MLVTTKKEITKEEFEHLITRDVSEFYDYIENIACHSAFHPSAYGFLTPKVMNEEGIYYVSWQHYDSCD